MRRGIVFQPPKSIMAHVCKSPGMTASLRLAALISITPPQQAVVNI